jgi:acyl-homoserine lactone acylase PvdQ
LVSSRARFSIRRLVLFPRRPSSAPPILSIDVNSQKLFQRVSLLAILLGTQACGGGSSAPELSSNNPGVGLGDVELSLALTLDQSTPVRFEPIELTLTLTNQPLVSTAENVEVQLVLPSSLSYATDQAQSGSFDPSSLLWTVPILANGASTQLMVTVLLDESPSGEAINVVASITSNLQVDTNSNDDADSAQAQIQAGTVDLMRDAFGVPHVFASSDQGAYFGAGVAVAEDRLSQMIYSRLAFDGRVAEFFGRGTGDAFLTGDRTSRLIGFRLRATRAVAILDPEMRSLLNAYAAGVNQVINDPGTSLHPLFVAAGVPVSPWTSVDSVATWSFLGSNFSSSALTESRQLHDFEDLLATVGGDQVAALALFAAPVVYDESAAVVSQSDVPLSLQQEMTEYAASVSMGPLVVPFSAGPSGPQFSHSWVVSGDRTVDGKAILIADPRLPLDRPSTLYELHLQGETFNARGATLPGCVNFIVGQSGSLAWGGSGIGADQADLFRLKVDPLNHPNEYELDGVFRPFDFVKTEVIEILGESPVTEIYRESFFGPVVSPVVSDLDVGEEYSLRRVDRMEYGQDSSLGFLQMYRAADVVSFSEALEGFRYPSANLVFGDSGGRIGYWANGSMPVRSPAQPLSMLAGKVAQVGERSDQNWIDIIPHRLLPSVLDPDAGVLMTANNMPAGAWYPIDIKAGSGAYGESARSWRLRELVTAMPLDAMPPIVDTATFLAPHFDTVNPRERDLIQLALHAEAQLGVTFTPAASDALREAEGWLLDSAQTGIIGDKTGFHRGVALVSNIVPIIRIEQGVEMAQTYGAGRAAVILFLKTRLGEVASTGTANLQPFEITWIDDRLRDALEKTNDAYGSESNWLTGYLNTELTLVIPGWRQFSQIELDPNDVLTLGPLDCTDKDTLLSQRDFAYLSTAIPGDLDAGVSVLPFGQAEMGKVHDTDQTALFQSATFKPAPMTKGAIGALVGPVETTNLSF